ncbi:MAG: Do family serine endopeptidase [Myxococcaceae bacterium]
MRMSKAVVGVLWLVALVVPAQALAQGKEAALPTLAPLVEQVKGAVVNVDVQARRGEADDENGGELDPLERFFGRNRNQIRAGMGSGFIIDPKGLILTNNHVVQGAVAIRVRMEDGRSFDASVVGRDPLTDVAVIQVKGKIDGLPTVKLGDSSAMKVGDWVMAIGNPYGLASSVSLGIVSAMDRNIHAGPYDQFLQTDAAINPGNSGGPLFNLKGEVVGINTAIVAQASGIGFAVPSNVVRSVIPLLERDHVVTRGWLGVGIQDVDASLAKALNAPVTEGALITQVNPGSPAFVAGVKEDDVVVSLDGQKVSSGNALSRTVAFKRPDSVVALGVYRGGKQVDLKVKLGTRPDLEKVGNLTPAEQQQPKQGRIGLSFQDLDSQSIENGLRGAMIVDVAAGSPADRSGLTKGWVVTEANRAPIRGRDDLLKVLQGAKSGTVVLLKVLSPGGGGHFLRALEIP